MSVNMSREDLLAICASIIYGASLELEDRYGWTPEKAVEAAKTILDEVKEQPAKGGVRVG